MSSFTFGDIHSLLGQTFEVQIQAVIAWHRQDPTYLSDISVVDSGNDFLDLVLRQHWANFRLWHVEDRARRQDVGSEIIANCKYAIDKLNQERNDLLERLDMFLVWAIEPLLASLPQPERLRYNTETLGMALDRGSILALKAYHMNEQAERTDVALEQSTECRRKFAVLTEQRADLLQSILDLLSDYSVGLKRPKVYYQFKMYNDARLNPELYTRKNGA